MKIRVWEGITTPSLYDFFAKFLIDTSFFFCYGIFTNFEDRFYNISTNDPLVCKSAMSFCILSFTISIKNEMTASNDWE